MLSLSNSVSMFVDALLIVTASLINLMAPVLKTQVIYGNLTEESGREFTSEGTVVVFWKGNFNARFITETSDICYVQ